MAAATLAFASVLALWGLLTPAFAAPDETLHLNSAVRLTQGWSWPAPGDARVYYAIDAGRDQMEIAAGERSTWADLVEQRPGLGNWVDQMTQHPPLYYAYGAAVLSVIGFEDLRIDQSLLALRWAGALFLLPLPFLAWNSVRRITRSPRAAVVGSVAVFAVPQLAHIGASASNDNLSVLLCSVVVWLCVRVMTGDARLRVVAAMAIALGLALLTKGTALPLVPFALAAVGLWPRSSPRSHRILRTLSMGAVAFALGGWWWVRNLLRFGDLQPSGLAPQRETVPWAPGTAPDLFAYLDLMWSRVSVSFWGMFGKLEYPLPELVTDVLTVIALAMIVAYFCVRDPNRARMAVIAALPVLIFVMLTANTWRHYVRTQLTAGMQGRYFFVAIIAIIVLSAVAWRRLISARRRVVTAITAVCAFFAVAALGVFRMYIGAYEDSAYRVTADGLSELRRLAIAGGAGVALLGCAALVAGVVAAVIVVRYVRAPRLSGAVSSP